MTGDTTVLEASLSREGPTSLEIRVLVNQGNTTQEKVLKLLFPPDTLEEAEEVIQAIKKAAQT